MHDQGIEPGPALGFENVGDGAIIGGIGAEPVNGFGGKGDE